MKDFWFFARRMLRYKRRLAVAGAGLLIDTIGAGVGMAAIMVIITQVLNEGVTAHTVVDGWLRSGRTNWLIEDPAVITRFIPDDGFWGFVFILAVVLVIFIVGQTGRFLHAYLAQTVSIQTTADIRRSVFQRLVHMRLASSDDVTSADSLSKLVRDCNVVGLGFSSITGKAARSVAQAIAFVSVAFIVSWEFSLIFTLFGAAIGVVIRRFGKQVRRATKRLLVAYSAMVAVIQETMLALPVVKANQSEGYERRRFNRVNRATVESEMKTRLAKTLVSPATEFIAMVGVMFIASIAAWLIYRTDSANREELVGSLMALGLAGGAFKPLGNLNNDLEQSAAAAVRVREAENAPVEGTKQDGHVTRRPALPRHRASVAFEGVTFTYPTGDRPAIDGVDLAVPFGATCAIVGGNGSGKSTLLHMIPRLYDPSAGRVLIDGHDIAGVSLRSLRAQIAVVNQATVLFDGTIADNIRYGCRAAREAQVVAASRQALAHDFISALPNGYNTDIGEFGGRLSGGQRQRIAIARAILRNPAILILDEATSQIDADSEAKINRALAELKQGRTTFVIAHRLSTVVDADLTVVMDAGRIVATGKHADLLQSCAPYQVLCRTQLQPASV
jgi:subfamily B ATP-binding cassette protein MsbA